MSANDRYGTLFECDGKIAVRHRCREQDAQTACGKVLVFSGPKGTKLFFTDHDLPKETRCKKCYPKFKKRTHGK